MMERDDIVIGVQCPILSGYDIFIQHAEVLYCDSVSIKMGFTERQDLERRLKALTPSQRRNICNGLSMLEVAANIDGDFDLEEYWSEVRTYFQRTFPIREFMVVSGSKK